MLYKVSIELRFDAAHRLCDYSGKCHNLHGHTYFAIVDVACAELISPGFVVDFVVLKKAVKDWIDANWDHATILWVNDPLVSMLGGLGLRVFCMEHEPTAEHMADVLFECTRKLLLDTMEGEVLRSAVVTQVSIKETPTSTATYCKG